MSPNTVSETLRLAAKYQQDHRLTEARQIYRQILAQQPQNTDALSV